MPLLCESLLFALLSLNSPAGCMQNFRFLKQNATLVLPTVNHTASSEHTASGSTTEEMRLPAVVFTAPLIGNVQNYGAKGDGITDDTDAIQRALIENNVVYFPAGTYRVRNTLSWTSRYPRGLVIQGQNRDSTIIKLIDNAPGFDNSSDRKPLLTFYEGGQTGNAFNNGLYNITLDVGAGNPAAVGLRFISNNQGSLRDVVIRSSDPAYLGAVGLLLDRLWTGPILIKNVIIDGFDIGLESYSPEYGQVFEQVTLRNQRWHGIKNYGNILTFRKLVSESNVPVIQNLSEVGLVSLIDSRFIAEAMPGSAIDLSNGALYLRNVLTAGYSSALDMEDGQIPIGVVAEATAQRGGGSTLTAIETLDLPIQETPVVRYPDPASWANVADYGAVPNDDQDDTKAFQAAINSEKSVVYFVGGEYRISSSLQVDGNVEIITGLSSGVLSIAEPLISQTRAVFQLKDGRSNLLVLERFYTGFGGDRFHWFDNARNKTLLLRNIGLNGGKAYQNSGLGNLFVEDVTGAGWKFNQQSVWARQLNPEASISKIINQNSNLWILGIKTEGSGTIIETRQNGQTELIGGLIYPSGAEIPSNQPAFISRNSWLSIAGVAESRYVDSTYSILVEETRNGNTKKLLHQDVSDRGAGFLILKFHGFDFHN